jgi:hypothetical protein
LLENTEDELIRQEVKNKLEFVPLSSQEEDLITFFLENNHRDPVTAEKLRKKLINKGE